MSVNGSNQKSDVWLCANWVYSSNVHETARKETCSLFWALRETDSYFHYLKVYSIK